MDAKDQKAADDAVWTKELYVCKGRKWLFEAKTMWVVLQQLSPEKELVGEDKYFEDGKDMKRYSVGAVYEIETTPLNEKQRSYRLRGATFKWLWGGPERDEWKLLNDASEMQATLFKKEKDAKAELKTLESLDPIRRAYWKTNATGRMALELAILKYIRSMPHDL